MPSQNPPDDLRLIEDYLPIEAISKEASREKSVRKGHISTLHLWWARRPLVACRAAVYGALVPASRFVPNGASDAKKKSLGRANAAKFVTRLCRYPSDSDKGHDVKVDTNKAIADAQQHILEAHAQRLSAELTEGRKTGVVPAWVNEFKFAGEKVAPADIAEGRAPRPRVLDMFAGGGAIPLEALRLGCEAYALDLNPVAHIIQLCTLVYPQKYGRPDLTARGMTGQKDSNGKATWGGLAMEVRYWGKWVLEKVRTEIGDLYPLVRDPDAKELDLDPEQQKVMKFAEGSQLTLKIPRSYLTPVAYLWTRTVRCKNPNCSASVPLVKQTWLSKKHKPISALRRTVDQKNRTVNFHLEVCEGAKSLSFDPEDGSYRGSTFCPICGTAIDNGYVMLEGCAGRIGRKLMCMLVRGGSQKGKRYLAEGDYPGLLPVPSDDDVAAHPAYKSVQLSELDAQIPSDRRESFWCRRYGLTRYSDLYTNRQKLFLGMVARLIRESLPIECMETGQRIAVQSYLACLLDKLADYNSNLCHWHTTTQGVSATYARQALPMVWDFPEINPFAGALADSQSLLESICDVIQGSPDGPVATVVRDSATSIPFPDASMDCVVTDPPYYDNISYAKLADYFYVWMRNVLKDGYPDHFASSTTPKKREAIVDIARSEGDRDAARIEYEELMTAAMKEAHRVLHPRGTLVCVYAHKTTLGWSSLVNTLRAACFEIVEAWPLDTEMKTRVRAADNASLATSIFLVARRRDVSVQIGNYENDVQPDLAQIVRERVDTLWDMGIAGADLVIAAVGAGLRAFTKYEKVEYANGEEVPAEKFLAEVEGVVLDSMMDKLSGATGGNLSAVDPASRFYVLWRYVYKTAEIEAGEAIVFTYAQHVELDGAQGLSGGTDALVEKKKAKYRARDFTERGKNDKLGLPSEAGQVAPLIDILHRVLWLMDNSPRKLPEFLDESRPDRERLRVLAQALAGAALSGKSEQEAEKLVSTTTAEQSALGKLLANWRSLIELGQAAATVGKEAAKKSDQGRLDFGPKQR